MVQSNLMFLRSYVRTQEFDLTQTISAPAGTAVFIQGEFYRGPVSPTYVSPSRYPDLYGSGAYPQISFAPDTALVVGASTANMLLNRLTNEAKYAGLDIAVDDDEDEGLRVLLVPFSQGANKGYDKSGILNTSGVSILKLPTITTGQSFEMDITDGSTVVPVTVAYATSHNATVDAIALAVTSAIQTFSPNLEGEAIAYVETSSPIAMRHTIMLRKPNDASIEFLSPAITASPTNPTDQPSLIDADTCWLGTLFAENPGEWAHAYGAKVLGVDTGIQERFRITFSGPLVTSNVINMYVNGAALTPVPFNTDSDTTLGDLADALTAHSEILNAYVEEVAGATNNDRSIVVIAKKPGVDKVTLSAPVVTGGASQAIAVENKILKGEDSNGAITIGIYNTGSVNYPVEQFQFTTYPYIDGRGNQLLANNVINIGSTASLNTRLVINPELANRAAFEPMLAQLLDPEMQYRDTISWLAGGDDGLSVTTGQMVSALDQLEDRIRYPVNLLLSAGYTAIPYLQALTLLAETRGDCTGILDMPLAKQAAQDAYNFRMFELNINSSYSAIYTPDVQISDITTGEERYIPPSGPVAAAYVYNDAVRNRYAAPAGLNRGPLRSALGLRTEYTPQEQELLNPVGVNTIVNKPATGPTIMSEETLQLQNSALRSVHIRRTLNDVKTTLADDLEWQLMEANTEGTRFNITQLSESVLSQAHRMEGLYSYYIKCDETNNTPDVIDSDVIICDIYVKPIRVAKGILLRSFITRNGIQFQELVTNFSF